MQTWKSWLGLFTAATLLQLVSPVFAESPWTPFIPFKRIDADPNASYELGEEHGPWLILAASFAGEGADRQAHELVMELRKRYKLPAYVHRQQYDFTEPVQGLTINQYGEPAKMRYANASRYEAIAVVVGDFPSVNDPALEKTLDKIKHARPDCLVLSKDKKSTQKFVVLREWYRRMNGDVEKRNKGPMGNAFVTRNPRLPAGFFAPQGPDEFVVGLNRGVKHSLLESPGKYTVRVATFRGNDTINQKEIEEIQRSGKVTNKLEIAADNAHRLTTALRARGVEAYEFHDRHQSIVTVGSFESEGTPRPDGSVEINPAVLRIMETYAAKRRPIPGQPLLGLQPQAIDGIALDVQPLPMKVPRASVSTAYARGSGILR